MRGTERASAERRLEGVELRGNVDVGMLAGYRLDRCTFDNCRVGTGSIPTARVVIQNVEVRDATQRACVLDGALLEEVTLDGLRRLGNLPLFAWGCSFRHVTLQGVISMLKLNALPRRLSLSPHPVEAAEWHAAQRAFYEEAEWALDISQARFQSLPSLEAVPGDRIVRDEATQVLVRREVLAQRDWRSFPFNGTAIQYGIEWFLKDSPFDSTVLVAPKASRSFERDLAVLQGLRSEGLAS